MRKTPPTAAALLLALAACAGGGERGRRHPTPATPRPSPTAAPAPTPPPVEPGAARVRGTGVFDRYRFSYERAGEQTEAAFAPTRLPYNDAVVVGAAREVIFAAYGERMENFPRRVRWSYGDSEHAIKLAGREHDYVFVHLADDRKEIPRLVFWRVPKGTVD